MRESKGIDCIRGQELLAGEVPLLDRQFRLPQLQVGLRDVRVRDQGSLEHTLRLVGASGA